jgi:hypothetical protein
MARRRSVEVLGLLALVTLVAFFLLPSHGAAAGGAMVRVVHASPDAPAVDVFVDGQQAISGLKFTEATTYVTLPAGSHQVQVFATGTGPGGMAVIDAKVALQDGQAYTIAAVNKLAAIEPLVLTDNLSAPAAGKAHIRVVHASPDAPAVDVGVQSGPTPVKNLAFRQSSPYTPVDAGTYTFQVFPAGTAQAVLTTNPVALDAGKIYDLFALGLLADKSLQVAAFSTAPAGASMPGLPTTGAGGMAQTAGTPTSLMLPGGGVLLLAVAGLVLLRSTWRLGQQRR